MLPVVSRAVGTCKILRNNDLLGTWDENGTMDVSRDDDFRFREVTCRGRRRRYRTGFGGEPRGHKGLEHVN